MRNRVIKSLENSTGDYCVDIFIRPDGTFGFEEFRRDAEDRGGWRSLNRYSLRVFNSEDAALAQALEYVAWLKPEEA
jgi:hypothetical protein